MYFKIFLRVFLGLSLLITACTKVVVRAKDQKTQPVSEAYSSNLPHVFEKSKEVLAQMGYTFTITDEATYFIETRWVLTTSDSHYLPLFGRKDFAASQGSYYKLQIQLSQEGTKVGVMVSGVLQTVSGQLNSSEVEEKKFLKKLKNSLRSSQIEVNNVGVIER